MHRVLLAVLVFIPLISLATSPTPSLIPISSGIEGVILVSPSRPGPIRKDEPGMAAAANVTFAVMREGAKVASFTTDAEGRFRIALPPGRYIVEKDPATKIGRWHFEAEVKAGEMTTVRWVGDSGMR